MEFGQLDGREDGEHIDVGFVEMSWIFVMQDAFFLKNLDIWWSIL